MLRLEGLVKTYPTGDKALKGVTLEVPKGQVIGLIGPSGAGKSTLIRCINRLVEPTGGKVFLGDEEVTAKSSFAMRRLRRQMGMIFQEYALVERLTVMENVLSGRLGYVGFWRSYLRRFPQSDVDEAFRLLERVGLDTMVDKRADALSGGQRQRVGVARALMQRPKLLLVDEPTSSLDPKIGREVMDLMSRLAAEEHIPMLVSVHDLDLAQAYSNRIVGLQGGVKVLDSKTSDVDADTLENVYHIASAA